MRLPGTGLYWVAGKGWGDKDEATIYYYPDRPECGGQKEYVEYEHPTSQSHDLARR